MTRDLGTYRKKPQPPKNEAPDGSTTFSGYTTSAREQLLTLYRIRPDAARQVNLDPETLREQPYPSNGYNADLLTRDTGWRPQYTFEEALEDYLKY